MIDLDGSDNKGNLGANALLAISLAAAKPRPRPRACRCSATWAAARDAGADDEHHQRRRARGQQRRHPGVHDPAGRGAELRRSAALRRRDISRAEERAARQGMNTAVGDEGGFAPNLPSNRAALDTIMTAIEKAGFTPGDDILLGLDVASSEFYQDGVYDLESEGRQFDAAGFSAISGRAGRCLPDHHDRGWHGRERLGGLARAHGSAGRPRPAGWRRSVRHQYRDPERGIDEKIANSILIKPNQIGTLSETLDAITMAVDAGFHAVISHRSGETSDSTIADIAVGTRATQIKTGSLSRSDRIAKYNQLLRIEEELGGEARMPLARHFPLRSP